MVLKVESAFVWQYYTDTDGIITKRCSFRRGRPRSGEAVGRDWRALLPARAMGSGADAAGNSKKRRSRSSHPQRTLLIFCDSTIKFPLHLAQSFIHLAKSSADKKE